MLNAALGSGRSGLKAGDRVHPGASSLVFTMVPEDEVEATVAAVPRARADSGFAGETRVWAFEVQELH